MPSLSVQKIYSHGDTACSTSNLQAYLPQWPTFLQHAFAAVMQLSEYSVFYDKDTPIWLSLSWQSYTPISISTLKPSLRTIRAILLKLWASPILSSCI